MLKKRIALGPEEPTPYEEKYPDTQHFPETLNTNRTTSKAGGYFPEQVLGRLPEIITTNQAEEILNNLRRTVNDVTAATARAESLLDTTNKIRNYKTTSGDLFLYIMTLVRNKVDAAQIHSGAIQTFDMSKDSWFTHDAIKGICSLYNYYQNLNLETPIEHMGLSELRQLIDSWAGLLASGNKQD